MYPWAMKYCLLPYGDPVYFSGKYKPSPNYPLYVISFICEFKLKPNKYPSIQLKHTSIYSENEYLTQSVVPTVLTLTSVDYQLFIDNYYILKPSGKIGTEDDIEFDGGYMFKARHGMFDEYIDYWYDQKTKSKAEGNKGLEKIAKLMLNSLYGKFGARREGKSKIPYYDSEKDIVRYKSSESEERKALYLPIATFITSYCRDKIIRAAEVCGDRFIYADTDSVHIKGDFDVPGMDVDDFRLGAFKLEEVFVRGKFIRQKTYLEVYNETNKQTGKIEEKINLKCCGMPRKLQKTVSEKDFYEGAEFDHNKNEKFEPKLMPKIVPGGVILRETTFQIKKAKSVEPLIVQADENTYIEYYNDGRIDTQYLPC